MNEKGIAAFSCASASSRASSVGVGAVVIGGSSDSSRALKALALSGSPSTGSAKDWLSKKAQAIHMAKNVCFIFLPISWCSTVPRNIP